ncbi:BQ5605_C007g04665 [Microbotryum silenes-dioicae]|uniref:BQ5605_C007g04665 protein n=1 Tax=Microbotryum silenes-dioicae TaxID=796604 RepID=A0A2X0MC20_9BASI|nr:BQ5605_C007g04665 [Microbotryum silenes-dioicae]
MSDLLHDALTRHASQAQLSPRVMQALSLDEDGPHGSALGEGDDELISVQTPLPSTPGSAASTPAASRNPSRSSSPSGAKRRGGAGKPQRDKTKEKEKAEAMNNAMDPMVRFPNVVNGRIFGELDMFDLLSCGLVCQRWRNSQTMSESEPSPSGQRSIGGVDAEATLLISSDYTWYLLLQRLTYVDPASRSPAYSESDGLPTWRRGDSKINWAERFASINRRDDLEKPLVLDTDENGLTMQEERELKWAEENEANDSQFADKNEMRAYYKSLRNAKGVKTGGGKGGIRTWEGDGLGAEASTDLLPARSYKMVQLNETFASASSLNSPREGQRKPIRQNPLAKTGPSPTSRIKAATAGSASTTTSTSSSSNETGSSSSPQLITAAEQSLLAYLSDLAKPIINSPDFKTQLQTVKSALYEKDYDRAFGSDLNRLVYTARWVPSRAIIYRRIYRESPDIKETLRAPVSTSNAEEDKSKPVKVLMLGGGAGSEVIALVSLLERVTDWSNRVEITAIDNSDWSEIIKQQSQALFSSYPETLSPERLAIKFLQADVLTAFPTPDIPYAEAKLVTILFTISELLLQARSTTLSLLAYLTQACQKGTLLLIVESAALAQIPIGSSGRTYPLGTLLDHALAPPQVSSKGRKEGEAQEGPKWEIVRSEDSVWYRMPIGSSDCYPLALENSRVVLRLYRKL